METAPYARSPIREALIDIRVALRDTAGAIERLRALHADVAGLYPRLSERYEMEGRIELGSTVGASSRQTLLGFAFSSEDGKRIFQARTDGFTFNWLAPYDSWSKFSDEALRLWKMFRSVAELEAVTRIAVRYINEVDVPADPAARSLRRYFALHPKTPAALTPVDAFFLQIQIPQADVGGTAIVNQATKPSADGSETSVLLDIDVSSTWQTEMIPGDPEVASRLQALREIKNRIFENCITDRTRDLIR